METHMQYKSIVLELLKQRTKFHEQLRKKRKLLATVELYSRELKSSHEAWMFLLTQIRPGSAPSQVASEALEIALKELEERLPSGSTRGGDAAVILDAAMMFIRRHTSRG